MRLAGHEKSGMIVGYARVSTQEQADSGFSLDTQRRRIIAFCEATGRPEPSILEDDGFSAATMRRPALRQLLSQVRTGVIEAVLVTKLDRLTRSLEDLLLLVKLFAKHKVALISATESIDTETPAGKMFLHLLGVFAEFERARIGERTKEVLARNRSQLKPYSRHVPFGFLIKNGLLAKDRREYPLLQQAIHMRSGGSSLRAIGDFWLASGAMPKNGRPTWHPQVVKDILDSQMSKSVALTL